MSRIARPLAASSGSELERQIRAVYGGGTTATGISVNSDNAMRVGAVYACVLVLAQSVAQLPLHLFEKKGNSKERTTSHYLSGLVCDEPNEWMTDYDMLLLLVTHLCLRGNSLWLKTQFPGKQQVRELIPINPDLIQGATQDERYRITYQVKRPKSSIVDDIPSHKILHFKGMTTNGFWGMNPVEYARESIGLSLAAEKHGAKLFANGARLGGILMHPGRLTKPARENVIESFNDAYSGTENAHKTALFEEGMKWQQVTMTAVDTQFLESRKYQRSEIAGLFRVPSHLINDLEKATFSNVEHLDLSFVKHALTPYLVSIEKTFRKSLMTPEEKEKYFFKFNADGLQRGDLKSRSESYQMALLNGWLSPNEVREIEDRNPYPGGESYRVPMNTEPAGGVTDEP